MRKKMRINLEQLEDRAVPAASANLWANANQLTLSFAPDGTSVSGASSNLFGALNAAYGSPAGWEQTILKAFQTWAAQSNINIAVVADGGQPLGTAAQQQGDPRFGDIRITAAPQADTSVATGTPPNVSAGAWSGDLVFNSNMAFGSGDGQYDLYTVALHEAGHIFGLTDEPTDQTSALYYQYTGPRTGPNANDLSLLQSEYGTRTANAAANMQGTSSYQGGDDGGDGGDLNVVQLKASGTTPLTVTSSLSKLGESDYYSFQIDQGTHPGGVIVQLQTNRLSSLTGKVSVYNSNLQVVASGSAASALNGTISLSLGNVKAGDQYYIGVQGNSGNAFDIGTYQLTVNLHPNAPASLSSTIMGSSKDLKAQSATTAAPLIVATGTINSANTNFLYKVLTPQNATGGINVYVSAYGSGIVSPSLSLFDNNGNLLAVTNTPDANGVLSVGVATVKANTTYYVQVASGVGSNLGLGLFRLEVDLFQTAGPVSTQAMTLLPASAASSNTVLCKATTLQNVAGPPPQGQAPRTIYQTVDSLTTAATTLFYKVKTPNSSTGTNVMVVTVLAQNAGLLAPLVTVYDQNNNAVSTGTVLVNANGSYAVQLPNVVGGQNYTVAVSSGATANGPGVGNFFVNVNFQTAAATLATAASDTLTATQAQEYRALTGGENSLYSFSLAAVGGAGQQSQMYVFDGNGNLVFSLFANAGQSATTGNVYLNAGKYTVQFVGLAQTGALSPLTFNLAVQVLSDPLGPVPVTTSSNGGSTPPTSSPSSGPVVMSALSTMPTGPVAPNLNPYFYTF